MKFILLVYSAENVWNSEELEDARDRSVKVCCDLNDQGKYIHAAPLDSANSATCVSVRDGKQIVSDGPFAETKEQLVGYFLIDVADLNEAIRVAASVPGSMRGTTEIRPLVELPGLP